LDVKAHLAGARKVGRAGLLSLLAPLSLAVSKAVAVDILNLNAIRGNPLRPWRHAGVAWQSAG